ncbi:hypothetical protein [Hungatella hathewayi]|uniref:hypothetical protein n=1 Tax=Hungatella hathewayi TaxID=154046 RepID=UPI0035682120
MENKNERDRRCQYSIQPVIIVPALPILPSAALSSVSGGTTPLPSSALQTDKIFSTGIMITGWMEHWVLLSELSVSS